jgi:hypothetical protein
MAATGAIAATEEKPQRHRDTEERKERGGIGEAWKKGEVVAIASLSNVSGANSIKTLSLPFSVSLCLCGLSS